MKPIKNYEGRYSITEDGRIYSHKTKRFLAPKYGKDGYMRISLNKNGVSKSYLIHRLVGETFLENLENKPTIDHIDRNKHNNHVSNLRWATRSEQMFNCDTSKVHTKEHMENMCALAQQACKKAIECRDMNNHSILYQTYNSAEEASIELFGNANKKRSIQKCARGERKSSCGYWWRYQ